MDGTILSQGVFLTPVVGTNPNPGNATVSCGPAVTIQIPSAADWLRVTNFTAWGTAGTSAAYFAGTANAYAGVEYYWQRGISVTNTANVIYYSNTSSAMNGDVILSGGFTIYDPSGQQAGSQPVFGPAVAVSAVTNATRPVLSTASTAGVFVGSVIRLSSTAQTDVNGIDFVVGAVVANTSITLLTATNALATAPGVIGGAGFYRIVYATPLYYPARKVITNITAGGQVSTAVEHSLTVGQAIRFNIPAICGMIQLNPTPQNNYLYATVLSIVDAYNFTIDINTASFTAFTWPTAIPNQEPASVPTYEPIGANSAVALNANNSLYPQFQNQNVNNANNGVFADATINTGYYGMILGGGGNGNVLTTPISGPAGVVYWSAGNVATPSAVAWVAGKADFGGL